MNGERQWPLTSELSVSRISETWLWHRWGQGPLTGSPYNYWTVCFRVISGLGVLFPSEVWHQSLRLRCAVINHKLRPKYYVFFLRCWWKPKSFHLSCFLSNVKPHFSTSRHNKCFKTATSPFLNHLTFPITLLGCRGRQCVLSRPIINRTPPPPCCVRLPCLSKI